MDFKDQLLLLAERVGKLKDNVKTEEATKTSFILPFLQALGYDIFINYPILLFRLLDIIRRTKHKPYYENTMTLKSRGESPGFTLIVDLSYLPTTLHTYYYS